MKKCESCLNDTFHLILPGERTLQDKKNKIPLEIELICTKCEQKYIFKVTQ